MILNSFSILNGVGEKTEKKLWSKGFITWHDYLAAPRIEGTSAAKKRFYDSRLTEALENLEAGRAGYFASVMNRSEHWRLFDYFKGDAVCLDIETNGYPSWDGGYPTVVGLYDGHDFRALVHGRDLDTGNLAQALSGYKYLITFFGASFDIPFLEQTMPGFSCDLLHFDLCFGGRKVGMSGGLKKIETELGISRTPETEGLNGYDAVLMWNEALKGNALAMERLIQYNREDTVNLMRLADIVYSRLRESTGIQGYLPQ